MRPLNWMVLSGVLAIAAFALTRTAQAGRDLARDEAFAAAGAGQQAEIVGADGQEPNRASDGAQFKTKWIRRCKTLTGICELEKGMLCSLGVCFLCQFDPMVRRCRALGLKCKTKAAGAKKNCGKEELGACPGGICVGTGGFTGDDCGMIRDEC